MRIRYLLVLLAVAEIAVTILVGQAIGILPTFGLGLLSTAVGAVLLRRQGLAALRSMRADAGAGRVPARSLLDGAAVAGAALLMIVPGFITDVAGAALLVPAVRAALGRRIRSSVERRAATKAPPHRSRAGVLELDQSEYASRARPETPWRPDAHRP